MSFKDELLSSDDAWNLISNKIIISFKVEFLSSDDACNSILYEIILYFIISFKAVTMQWNSLAFMDRPYVFRLTPISSD